MNYFTSFLTAFCVAAIFIGAVFLICPNGKMSQPLKYILSLIFTLVVISSVSKFQFDFDFTLPKSETYTENADAIKIQSAEYVLSSCLKANNINFSKIEIQTTNSNDNSIIINKVIIFSNDEKDKIISSLAELSKEYEVEIKNE